MKTKTMRTSILCLVVLLLWAPLLRAQDLAKYRHFTMGMSLTTVLKHTDQRMTDVKVIHGRPAMIQELEWWPPNLPGSSFQSDTVKQILFSFYNSELYKISVTYDPPSTQGLTEEDIVKSISAKYGPATIVAPEIDSAAGPRFNTKQTSVASWEDVHYSVNLVRSSFSDVLGLVVLSRRVNKQAELAPRGGGEIHEQKGPKTEGDPQKKKKGDIKEGP